jgi:hypothetical protein
MTTTETTTGKVTRNGLRWKGTNSKGLSSFFDTEEDGWLWVNGGENRSRSVMTCEGKTRSRGSRKFRQD